MANTYFDPLIIVFAVLLVLIPLFSLVMGCVFIKHFVAEDDRKRAWLPKLIVLLAFVLGTVGVLLCPVDLISGKNAGLGLGSLIPLLLGIVWQVFYGFVAFVVVVVMPFTMFFYEAEDPEKGCRHQALWGCIFTSVLVVLTCVVVIPTYFFFGQVKLPYVAFSNATPVSSLQAALTSTAAVCSTCYQQGMTLSFQGSFIAYLIAVISVAGWILFATCGGCGLTACPCVCIKACVKRPRRIRSNEFCDIKVELQRKAERLIELGMKMDEAREEGKLGRKDIRLFNQFKEAVYQVQTDWENLEAQFYMTRSIFAPFFKGIIGFICGLLTIIILLHTVLDRIVPVDVNIFNVGVLNIAFRYADTISINVPIIGGIGYALLATYMLFCVLAGSRYVASRIPFFAVHPLKPHDTLMNSMVFNLLIYVLCSVTITQFCQDIFSGYTATSTISTLFNTIVRNFQIFGYFFRYVHYVWLVFCFIGAAASMVVFKETTVNEKKVDDLLRRLS